LAGKIGCPKKRLKHNPPSVATLLAGSVDQAVPNNSRTGGCNRQEAKKKCVKKNYINYLMNFTAQTTKKNHQIESRPTSFAAF
jgi:hypothetical protein